MWLYFCLFFSFCYTEQCLYPQMVCFFGRLLNPAGDILNYRCYIGNVAVCNPRFWNKRVMIGIKARLWLTLVSLGWWDHWVQNASTYWDLVIGPDEQGIVSPGLFALVLIPLLTGLRSARKTGSFLLPQPWVPHRSPDDICGPLLVQQLGPAQCSCLKFGLSMH